MTHSFPTPRSSDLAGPSAGSIRLDEVDGGFLSGSDRAHGGHEGKAAARGEHGLIEVLGGPPGIAHLEIGRAHVRTPVTNAHLVCRLLLEKKKQYQNIITRKKLKANTRAAKP